MGHSQQGGKSYGETLLLRGVSLEVVRREVVVMIGASGSGKTTLLRCVAGLEPIQSGQIYIFGTPVRRAWELHGEVGFVFQHFNLFPHMTALTTSSSPWSKVRGLQARPGTRGRWTRFVWSGWRSLPGRGRPASRAGSSSASRSRAPSR